jgi:2-(1,2-epoxy-1,2-dihydrophenyl)acetyl-CoA isomerase
MNASASDPILVEEHPGERILVVTLNRPDAANSIDTSLAAALESVAARVLESRHLDAVVLTGNGRIFSAGGDIGAFKSTLETASDPAAALAGLLDGLALSVHRSLQRLVEAGPLIIGAINGPATGAGLGLVCACDIAYASAEATLRSGFSRLGLSPDTGTTYFLSRIVGYRKALELLLLGRAIGAAEARELGIYSEVLEPAGGDFLEQVIARTRLLLASGPAVRETRDLLRRAARSSLPEQLDLERQRLVALAATPSVSAGIGRVLGPGPKS